MISDEQKKEIISIIKILYEDVHTWGTIGHDILTKIGELNPDKFQGTTSNIYHLLTNYIEDYPEIFKLYGFDINYPYGHRYRSLRNITYNGEEV